MLINGRNKIKILKNAKPILKVIYRFNNIFIVKSMHVSRNRKALPKQCTSWKSARDLKLAKHLVEKAPTWTYLQNHYKDTAENWHKKKPRHDWKRTQPQTKPYIFRVIMRI